MILKEAFTYQNYLTNLIAKSSHFLCDRSYVTSTVEYHFKHKSNRSVEDETITVQKPDGFTGEISNLIDFHYFLLNEKDRLAVAISDAKRAASIDRDYIIASNKSKQEFINVLSWLSNIRASENLQQGSDYTFNVDGNQVRYYYDLKKVTTIDFDRNEVRKLAKKLSKEVSESSYELDKMLLTTDVNFSPIIELNDDFQDALETFNNISSIL